MGRPWPGRAAERWPPRIRPRPGSDRVLCRSGGPTSLAYSRRANESLSLAISGTTERIALALAFRLGKIVLLELATNPELSHRFGFIDRLLQQIDLSVLDELGRILPLWHHRHPEIESEFRRQPQFVSPNGRTRASLVCIEGQHDTVTEPPQQVEMILTECSSACRHCHRVAGEVKSDHVGVSLNHHGKSELADLGSRLVQAV